MDGLSDSDCTKTSGRSTRQAATLNEGCEEWLGEEGQGEEGQGEEGQGEDMMEMGEVKESVEIGRRMCCSQNLGEMYHESGSRCTHHLTTPGRLGIRG